MKFTFLCLLTGLISTPAYGMNPQKLSVEEKPADEQKLREVEIVTKDNEKISIDELTAHTSLLIQSKIPYHEDTFYLAPDNKYSIQLGGISSRELKEILPLMELAARKEDKKITEGLKLFKFIEIAGLLKTAHYLDVPLCRDILAESLVIILLTNESLDAFRVNSQYTSQLQFNVDLNKFLASRVMAKAGCAPYFAYAPTKDSKPQYSFSAPRKLENKTSFSKNYNKSLFGILENDVIIIREIATGEIKQQVKYPSAGTVYSFCFDPQTDHVITTSWDCLIRISNITTAEVFRILRGHTEPVHCSSYNLDGTVLVSGSRDGTVRFWDVPNNFCFLELKHSAVNSLGQLTRLPVNSIEFHKDREGNEYLFSFCSDNKAYVWKINSSQWQRYLTQELNLDQALLLTLGYKALSTGIVAHIEADNYLSNVYKTLHEDLKKLLAPAIKIAAFAMP